MIGGSEDYTGAPYFSAMASAKLGCDMVAQTPLLSTFMADIVTRSHTSSVSQAPAW